MRRKFPKRNSRMEKVQRRKNMRKTVSDSQVGVITIAAILLCAIFFLQSKTEININYSGNLDYITI